MCALTGASLGAFAIGFALTWTGFLQATSTLSVHADVIENCDVKLTADFKVELRCNSRIRPDVRVIGSSGAVLLLVNY